ncbi:52 kDa repressor of the inhibitor of the protein kinase [Leptinotarsa decemlineata]|uniref:52 kDa repressor of the inhibitor of the protein kinase n=1 Tax=Leptinotarsa decemlineata TaxID=7539 RepID=UPI003D309D43
MSENKRKASNQGTLFLFKFFKKQTVPKEAPDDTENAGSGFMNIPTKNTELSRLHQKPEEDGKDGDGCNLNDFYSNDIGLHIHGQVTEEEKEKLLTDAWVPDENFKSPSTQFGKRQLKFQYSWLKSKEWVTYSKKLNGALCKYFFLFAPCGAGKQGLQLGRLVTSKYCDWKHALEDFSKHQLTSYHSKCKLDAENFSSIRRGAKQSIVAQIDKSGADQVKENRRRLTPVIKTVTFCGRQGLALRGHRDGGILNITDDQDVVENEGNFRALLRMRVESGDEDLKQHLMNADKNATYISAKTQNEIISTCNDLILTKLVAKVNAAQCFTVIADETTDISCTEQLSLCARYIDQETLTIREDFLQFVPVNDLTGKELSDIILKKRFGISTEYIRGQGYDGAFAMSGAFNGVQAFMKKGVPSALYVHCSSHSLNLAISDACNSTMIRNCMGTVSKTYDFLHTPKRQAVLKKFLEKNSNKLMQCSPTRWIQRHKAIMVFAENYEAILRSLEDISTWDDRESSSNANILHCALTKADFILSLFVIKKMFTFSLPLTKYLETKEIDLTSAVNYAESTVNVLKEVREKADEEFSVIFKDAQDICKREGISIDIPRTTSRQTCRENIENDGPESYYRRSLFIPFVDHFISQHKDVLTSFDVLTNSKMENKTTQVSCEILFKKYQSDLLSYIQGPAELYAEIKIWHQRLVAVNQLREETHKQSKPTKHLQKKISGIEALQSCNRYMFPAVFKLLQILATLPVTSCTAERSFSTLRYLKDYLRNSSKEARLNGLALLYIHKDVSAILE